MKQTWYSTTQDTQSPDAIHQILAYGTLDEIRLLKKAIGEETIKKLFLGFPKKIYTSSALYFIKHFILHITNPIDEQKYLRNAPRHT